MNVRRREVRYNDAHVIGSCHANNHRLLLAEKWVSYKIFRWFMSLLTRRVIILKGFSFSEKNIAYKYIPKALLALENSVRWR